MVLLPGTRLGVYEIQSALGAGGMGEVYRARDLELGRDVAIKVLHAAVAQDTDRIARFRREAQLLASLNHPNIAGIYGVADEGGVRGLVLELIEGPTLAEQIATGSLSLRDALSIGRQIAEALENAHENGVVHRDLKPANIKVTLDGTVKVLDFGLAKATVADTMSADSSHSPTLTVAATNRGELVGTAPYMSPEQARGKPIDKRTDIWAFGCVLYEMLSRRRAFAGEGIVDTLAAILDREPDWSALPPSVPRDVQRLLRRCLQKDPKLRLRDIGEARIVLTEAAKSSAPTITSVATMKWLIAAAALLALFAIAGGLFRRNEPVTSRAEYVQLTNFADSAVWPALSPDGRMLAFIRGDNAFVGPGQLYVKLLPDGEPVQLTHDDLHKMRPSFSLDGARIAYTASTGSGGWVWDTWVVSVLGGEPRLLLRNASGSTWFQSGASAPRLLFSELKGKAILMGIAAATESRAEARDVYVPASDSGMAHLSDISPDRRSVILAEMDAGTWFPCRLVPFDGGDRGKVVGPAPAQCTDARWSPDGRWMYFSANAGNGSHIWRQRFPDGAPAQITSGPTEENGIAVAPDGRSLVTAIGSSQSTVWVHDAHGDRQITSRGFGFLPSFSADGKKLYYLVRSGGSRHFVSGELWVADLGSGQQARLLPDFEMEHYNISPDGKRIVFVMSDAAGHSPLWVASLDGRSAPRKVSDSGALNAFFGGDGRIYFVSQQGTTRFVYQIKEDGTGLQKVVLEPVLYAYAASPDGNFLALWFGGSESEERHNSVVVYSLLDGRRVIVCDNCASAGGPNRGRTPAIVSWSADGRFMYVSTPGAQGKTFAVPLEGGRAVPSLPPSGLQSTADVAALPGAQLVAEQPVFVGPDPSLYAFSRVSTQRNIYRVPVP